MLQHCAYRNPIFTEIEARAFPDYLFEGILMQPGMDSLVNMYTMLTPKLWRSHLVRNNPI